MIGNFGLGWAFMMAAISWGLVSTVLIAGTASILPVGAVFPVLGVPVLGVPVLGFVFLVLFFSALKGVYTAVLYRYAVTGEDSLFDPEIVGSAFRSKR